MSKSNFLLVDLNEQKTKKLAETITSETSRKILNHLADKNHDTEANIAQLLELPISTVHYHLQKLQEASLITADEFHYSEKGREVNHYKLANKYIIIAPQKVSGLKEKLKGVLPVALASLAIAFVIKLLQGNLFTAKAGQTAESASPSLAQEILEGASEEAVREGGEEFKREAVSKISDETFSQTAAYAQQNISQNMDIAFWFLAGSFITMILYLLIALIREKWKE